MASKGARIIIALLYIICMVGPVSAQSLVDGMHYVTLIVFCIGALTALVDAFYIYAKMNNQEGDISKSILKLFGACVFLLIATYVLPGFFGIVRSDNVMFGW